MSAAPRITVRMPVFNGAATIAASIAAFTAQTCGDFELIISDNASTDGTRASVESLAARDGRICYLRQATNIGANLNYSQVAMLARGEFLKWASASDADAVLAVPRTRPLEGDRTNAVDYPEDIAILDATPASRLIHLLQALRLNNTFNGLIRVAALRRTRLVEPCQRASNSYWREICLRRTEAP